MAQQRRTVDVCDMGHRGDDVEAVGKLEVIIDGQARRLDVCGDHLKEARSILRPWLGAGASPRSTTTRSAGSSTAARREAAEIRQWAGANGYKLPGRGRIPSAVRSAYVAARR